LICKIIPIFFRYLNNSFQPRELKPWISRSEWKKVQQDSSKNTRQHIIEHYAQPAFDFLFAPANGPRLENVEKSE